MQIFNEKSSGAYMGHRTEMVADVPERRRMQDKLHRLLLCLKKLLAAMTVTLRTDYDNLQENFVGHW
jgi:hypothetical protein